MVKYISLIFIVSISFSQTSIETKEYAFYINKDVKDVNIMELIGEEDGFFKVELIMVDNIKYDRIKKLLVLPCELEISLSSELSNKPIEYKICKDRILSSNIILVDEKSPIIKITEDKYINKYFSCKPKIRNE